MIGRSHAHAHCGIHVTRSHPCVHCARAAVMNAAALADVRQRPAEPARAWKSATPKATEARILELHAAGQSKGSIARTLGLSTATVARVVAARPVEKRARRFAPDRDVKRANERMWAKSTTAQRDANRATPLPRGVRA